MYYTKLYKNYTSATLLNVISKQHPNVNRCVKQNDSLGLLNIYFPGVDFSSLEAICHWHCMSTQSIGPPKATGLWMYHFCPINSLINRQTALRTNLRYPKLARYNIANYLSVLKETLFDVRYLHFNVLSIVSDNNHHQSFNRNKPQGFLCEKLGVPDVPSCFDQINCLNKSKGIEEGLVEAAVSTNHTTNVFFIPTDANSKVRHKLVI